jgi:hypothetical protein
MSFEAKYASTCASCDERIRPGELVAYIQGPDHELVHDECHAKPRKPAEVCTTCWLEKPCGCDD